MAKKYDLITELYAEGIKEVTEQWLQFLNSACRNFRLPFDEQLLVYLQRPEASAVLGMEDWNRKFGRWVKHDSKAIAVFDKSGSTTKLKYYFDVTDTSENTSVWFAQFLCGKLQKKTGEQFRKRSAMHSGYQRM